jgi:hypothetical protein
LIENEESIFGKLMAWPRIMCQPEISSLGLWPWLGRVDVRAEISIYGIKFKSCKFSINEVFLY